MSRFGRRNAGPAPIQRQAPPPSLREQTDEDSDEKAALAALFGPALPYWANINPLAIILALLMAGSLLLALLGGYSRTVIRDLRLANTWEAAEDLRAVDGKCSRYFLLITFCHTQIKAPGDRSQPTFSSEFMMFFDTGAGELITPVRSTIDPTAISASYAVDDRLRNRALSFFLPATVLSAISFWMIALLAKGRFSGGAAHKALLGET